MGLAKAGANRKDMRKVLLLKQSFLEMVSQEQMGLPSAPSREQEEEEADPW